jgi:two-component sensor histidine kinase
MNYIESSVGKLCSRFDLISTGQLTREQRNSHASSLSFPKPQADKGSTMEQPHDPMERRIDTILVAQVYHRAGIALVGTGINASVLAYILWGRVSGTGLIVWLSLNLLSVGFRFFLIRQFKKAGMGMSAGRWKRRLVAGVGFSGFLWGSVAVFLFPESVAHQAFIAFVIAGMVAGAVGVFSAVLPAFMAFSIPALAPVIIRLAFVGDPLHMAMAFMSALFAFLTFTTARRIHAATRELVILKETFADQLEQRTAQLQELNAQYRREIVEHHKTVAALRTSESQIENALKEKTMLLQEIHHRVKNNMQVIISLMHLQSDQIKDERVRSGFKEAGSRVNAMALIHNILYESNSISEVNLNDYFKRLADSLVRMYQAHSVHINISADGCRLNMDQAIPCGLILNELISNSLKHAFRGAAGQIDIRAFPCEQGNYVVTVHDNGVGLPEHVDLDHAGTLGLKLVMGLAVHQLGGKIEVDRSRQGTFFRLEFACC